MVCLPIVAREFECTNRLLGSIMKDCSQNTLCISVVSTQGRIYLQWSDCNEYPLDIFMGQWVCCMRWDYAPWAYCILRLEEQGDFIDLYKCKNDISLGLGV